MAVLYHQIPVWPFQANCTIFYDDITHKAVVVDPGGDAPVILDFLQKNQLSIDSIWLTHAHYDHLSALDKMPVLSGVPLFIHEDDIPLFDNINMQAGTFCLPELDIKWPVTPAPTYYEVKGSPITINVLPTPGHSPGGISLYFPQQKWLAVGDTMFAHGGIGRTDFIGGSLPTLMQSIKDQLLTLPDDTIVLSGHGRNSTIAQERPFH